MQTELSNNISTNISALASWEDRISLSTGHSIRLRRRHLGVTQAQLAEDIGKILGKRIRFQQIHKYERGINSIPIVNLWAIAKVLQVSEAYFFESINSRYNNEQN